MRSLISVFLILLLFISVLYAKDRDKKDKDDSQVSKGNIISKVAPAAYGDVMAGEKRYRVDCFACHGVNGSGDGYAASLFSPPPTNFRDPKVMNMKENVHLFNVIKNGGSKVLSRDSYMPSFGKGYNDLDIWDLIAYIRSLHIKVDNFFPNAAYYIAKDYRIASLGKERIEKVIKEKISEEEETVTVYTVFRSDKPHIGGAEYIPQDPNKMDVLKKPLKLGYLAFFNVKSLGNIQVGIAIDPSGKILKMLPSDISQASSVGKYLSPFTGLGKRGKYEVFKIKNVPDKILLELYKDYLITLEASFVYEKEEKDRTWMEEE
ncbi:MAG: cytochrome c [Deltaproteobacteria bacterium]|nr:cytochrome c [Deltaproteobacteria bacterium]